MSFRVRHHAPAQKRQLFTNKVESRPTAHYDLKPATCDYCSMPSTSRCELPTCAIPLCEKHRVRKSGGTLCPKHQGSLLVQYDAFPSEEFGDRGDAEPHIRKYR